MFDKNPTACLVISAISTALINQIFTFENYHLTFFAWILYFVFGMYFSKYEKKDVSFKWLLIEGIAFLVTSIAVIYTQYMSANYKISFDYYASLFIVYSMIASVFFMNKFKFMERENKVQNFIINFFDKNTYLIFLYHCLFISIAQNDVINVQNPPVKNVFLAEFCVTGASILVMCIVFNMIRKLKKSRNGV